VALAKDSRTIAEAHHNAYCTALERRDWKTALTELQDAVKLNAARFAPFPTSRYEPQRILGAGGFGVVFLCQHRNLGRPVVIKSLLAAELDRDVTDLFKEAQILEDLNHPAIIKVRDGDYADEARKRPYLVMEYFEGTNLADFVAGQGTLSADDLLTVAGTVAEALQAAHERGILHRDVKPANVLVPPPVGEPATSERGKKLAWQVKLIDFGLALRPEALEGKASTSGPQARTMVGRSVAGTLHYAAPEQMGQSPGVAVGKYSDVYGFGRMCYYALLGTPEPDDGEKEVLPEGWRRLLSMCTRRKETNRLPDFAAVLAELARVGEPVRQEHAGSTTLTAGAEKAGLWKEHALVKHLDRMGVNLTDITKRMLADSNPHGMTGHVNIPKGFPESTAAKVKNAMPAGTTFSQDKTVKQYAKEATAAAEIALIAHLESHGIFLPPKRAERLASYNAHWKGPGDHVNMPHDLNEVSKAQVEKHLHSKGIKIHSVDTKGVFLGVTQPPAPNAPAPAPAPAAPADR
jgi:serine/threonine protein kinase